MAKSPTLKGARAQALVRQKQIARLRDLGLVAKGQGKTVKSRRGLITKFSDVLAGRASVVTVPRSEARKYNRGFTVKGRKVIVPRQKGERISVSKEGTISGIRKFHGDRIKRIVTFPGSRAPKARKGKRYFYVVPFANGGNVRFESKTEMQNFMHMSSVKLAENYKNFEDYVFIEEVDVDDDVDE